MSSNQKPPLTASARGAALSASVKKLLKLFAGLAILISCSMGLGRLGTIHGKGLSEDHFSSGYPTVLKLLDSEFFMGFVFFVTLALVVYLLSLLWQLHEVAVHKAKQTSSVHTQLVFALSLCGLFIDKTWWVLAIIIAFARWDVLASAVSQVIHRGINGVVERVPQSSEEAK